jgi:hypothetical protein
MHPRVVVHALHRTPIVVVDDDGERGAGTIGVYDDDEAWTTGGDAVDDEV